MTLTSAPSLIACLLFSAAMVHVVATDLLYRRIRNWLVAAMIAGYGPLAIAAGIPPVETGAALVAALIVFGIGFGCFAAGWIGGGDAKLAPVCVLWLGADQTLAFVLLTSLLGGALTLTMLLYGMVRRQPAGLATSGHRGPARSVPYGIALAASGLMLLRDSPWAQAL
jgi:prepilin peptidase CpaA